jgi:hypothetical protein
MRKVTKIEIALVLLAVAIVASTVLKIHYRRDDSGGVVLWNADQAYVFISVTSRGYHTGYLEYPWDVFKEYVHAPPVANDERSSFTVIRVTSSGVERHVVDVAENTPGNRPSLFTPFEGYIYANCQGALCKWSGTGFEPATEQERQRFGGTSHLTPEIDTNVDGWTKRGVAAGPADTFARLTADVGGRFELLEKSDPIDRTGYAAISLYAQRPGQAPERIWYLDGHPRKVSKAEYELTFGRP